MLSGGWHTICCRLPTVAEWGEPFVNQPVGEKDINGGDIMEYPHHQIVTVFVWISFQTIRMSPRFAK
jgi:hypothetical protein